MEGEIFNSRTQCMGRPRKSEDMSELRNEPTTTGLHQKKLIALSCDIGISSFLG
jgi:hypothetical protein